MEGNWRGKRGGYSSYNPQQYQSENKSFDRSQKQSSGGSQKPKIAGYFKRENIPKWLLDMPYWEKCFVLQVTSRWWKHFLDCQRGLDLYKNVFNWDDSAGAEAFHNAKIRFWAEMKSLPCDVPLPDPQMFIDDLDWDTIIDPEVCRDLEKAREPPEEEEEEELKTKFVDGLICYRGHPMNPSGWDNYKVIEPTGWDAEDSPPDPLSSLMKPIISSTSVYSNDEQSKPVYGLSPNTTLLEGGTKTSNISNSWENEPWGQKNLMKKKTGNSWEDDSGHSEKVQPGQKISWEDNQEIPSGQRGMRKNTMSNSWENNNEHWEDNRGGWQEIPSGQRGIRKNTMGNSWENNNEGWQTVRYTTNEYRDQNYSRNNGNWNKNENWRKKESQDQNLSRCKKTGYRPVFHQTNYESKNNRGKKSVSFAQEHAHGEPLAQQHWNSINP